MPENRKYTNTQWINILIILAVFVGATVFGFRSNAARRIEYQFEDDAMTLIGPDNAPFDVEIRYQDILSISETETLDVGTNLTGVCTDQCWFGTWSNDAYGTYTLCAVPTCEDYIVLETTEGTVVCNYEDAETTQSLYEAFVELLETKS